MPNDTPVREAGESQEAFQARVESWVRQQEREREEELARRQIGGPVFTHPGWVVEELTPGGGGPVTRASFDHLRSQMRTPGRRMAETINGETFYFTPSDAARFQGFIEDAEPSEPYTPNEEYTTNRPLALACNKVLNATKRQSMMPSYGAHEADYMNRVHSQARREMKGDELADTDVPVLLTNLTQRQYDELYYMRSSNLLRDAETRRFGWKCEKCAGRPAKDVTFLLARHFYCANHVPDLEQCMRCRNLSEDCVVVEQYDGVVAMLCKVCKKGTGCRHCGVKLPNDHILVRVCPEHLGVRKRGANRPVALGVAWIGKTLGEIVKSPRIFSCEIEAGTTSSDSMMRIANAIPEEAGMGHDGSIQLPNAFEIQSPKLAGKKGETFVQETTKVLHHYRTMVNESCGMHIHLDGRGVISPSRKTPPVELLQLWKAYLLFEDVTMSLLPYSRRRNDFCRPMGDAFKLIELHTVSSLLDAEKLWYKERTWQTVAEQKGVHRHESRYFGVNFHSLLSDGHLEIRYHSGTTNPRKILEWANLHCLIMDAAAAKKFTHEFLREAQATSSLKDKTEMLFSLIGLAKESQNYFHDRQRKFMDKLVVESSDTNRLTKL